jgi:NADH:ubiquinone oxidoreductase subunit 4 (subunit M)
LVFLACGLSLVGFPGTVGFVSDDLLMRAVLGAYPASGLLLFVATALSGFTVLRAYLRLFHGPPARGAVLSLLPREWLAALLPLGLVVGQGLHPEPLVELGSRASLWLLRAQSAEPRSQPGHAGASAYNRAHDDADPLSAR